MSCAGASSAGGGSKNNTFHVLQLKPLAWNANGLKCRDACSLWRDSGAHKHLSGNFWFLVICSLTYSLVYMSDVCFPWVHVNFVSHGLYHLVKEMLHRLDPWWLVMQNTSTLTVRLMDFRSIQETALVMSVRALPEMERHTLNIGDIISWFKVLDWL